MHSCKQASAVVQGIGHYVLKDEESIKSALRFDYVCTHRA